MAKVICKPILLEAGDERWEEKDITIEVLQAFRKAHRKAYSLSTNSKTGNIEIELYDNSQMFFNK